MNIEEVCGKNRFYCTLENDLLHLTKKMFTIIRCKGLWLLLMLANVILLFGHQNQ